MAFVSTFPNIRVKEGVPLSLDFLRNILLNIQKHAVLFLWSWLKLANYDIVFTPLQTHLNIKSINGDICL